MNLRVIISLVFAGIWLIVGLALLLGTQVGFPVGNTTISLGWLPLILVLWNLVRAALQWKSAPPGDQKDGYTRQP